MHEPVGDLGAASEGPWQSGVDAGVIWMEKSVQEPEVSESQWNSVTTTTDSTTTQGSSMIMDTLTGVLTGTPGHGSQHLQPQLRHLQTAGERDGNLGPTPLKPSYPTVDIRLVNPSTRIKKEDEEGEGMEDDTLNTPVSTSADVSTFFCTDTTISDPVPITDMLDSESCQTLRSCDALLESYRMLWDSGPHISSVSDSTRDDVTRVT
ncbi:uncharacterized protein CEXT_190951 [Caerostris extrusa]|uniref:Uncharacterized protein n=1 Tax=Caerostris extrusa TaxID=172846 RepID=A0AAV4QGS3_CAEEX|nr:uncharacterized protein CEXT_190951 [Caerostris extrusa]